eukprot:4292879-Prymnesium_polylepis.1
MASGRVTWNESCTNHVIGGEGFGRTSLISMMNRAFGLNVSGLAPTRPCRPAGPCTGSRERTSGLTCQGSLGPASTHRGECGAEGSRGWSPHSPGRQSPAAGRSRAHARGGVWVLTPRCTPQGARSGPLPRCSCAQRAAHLGHQRRGKGAVGCARYREKLARELNARRELPPVVAARGLEWAEAGGEPRAGLRRRNALTGEDPRAVELRGHVSKRRLPGSLGAGRAWPPVERARERRDRVDEH